MKSNFYKFIGALFIIQLLFFRLKDKVPRDISQLHYLFVFAICIIYLLVVMLLIYKIIINKYKKQAKPNEIVEYIKLKIFQPIHNLIKASYSTLDSYIKDELLGPNILGKFLSNFMIFVIKNIGVYYNTYKKLFIIFDVLPKIIILTFLFIDIILYNRLQIIYNFAWIPLLPLIFQYFIFTLREFTDFNIKGILQDYIDIRSLEPQYLFSAQDIIDECCNTYKENIFDLCSQEYLNRDFAIPLHAGRAYFLKDLVIATYSNEKYLERAFDKLLNDLNNFRILRQIIYNIDTCKMYWHYLFFDLFRFLSYAIIWFYACTFHLYSILNFLLLMIFFESPF